MVSLSFHGRLDSLAASAEGVLQQLESISGACEHDLLVVEHSASGGSTGLVDCARLAQLLASTDGNEGHVAVMERWGGAYAQALVSTGRAPEQIVCIASGTELFLRVVATLGSSVEDPRLRSVRVCLGTLPNFCSGLRVASPASEGLSGVVMEASCGWAGCRDEALAVLYSGCLRQGGQLLLAMPPEPVQQQQPGPDDRATVEADVQQAGSEAGYTLDLKWIQCSGGSEILQIRATSWQPPAALSPAAAVQAIAAQVQRRLRPTARNAPHDTLLSGRTTLSKLLASFTKSTQQRPKEAPPAVTAPAKAAAGALPPQRFGPASAMPAVNTQPPLHAQPAAAEAAGAREAAAAPSAQPAMATPAAKAPISAAALQQALQSAAAAAASPRQVAEEAEPTGLPPSQASLVQKLAARLPSPVPQPRDRKSPAAAADSRGAAAGVAGPFVGAKRRSESPQAAASRGGDGAAGQQHEPGKRARMESQGGVAAGAQVQEGQQEQRADAAGNATAATAALAAAAAPFEALPADQEGQGATAAAQGGAAGKKGPPVLRTQAPSATSPWAVMAQSPAAPANPPASTAAGVSAPAGEKAAEGLVAAAEGRAEEGELQAAQQAAPEAAKPAAEQQAAEGKPLPLLPVIEDKAPPPPPPTNQAPHQAPAAKGPAATTTAAAAKAHAPQGPHAKPAAAAPGAQLAKGQAAGGAAAATVQQPSAQQAPEQQGGPQQARQGQQLSKKARKRARQQAAKAAKAQAEAQGGSAAQQPPGSAGKRIRQPLPAAGQKRPAPTPAMQHNVPPGGRALAPVPPRQAAHEREAELARWRAAQEAQQAQHAQQQQLEARRREQAALMRQQQEEERRQRQAQVLRQQEEARRREEDVRRAAAAGSGRPKWGRDPRLAAAHAATGPEPRLMQQQPLGSSLVSGLLSSGPQQVQQLPRGLMSAQQEGPGLGQGPSLAQALMQQPQQRAQQPSLASLGLASMQPGLGLLQVQPGLASGPMAGSMGPGQMQQPFGGGGAALGGRETAQGLLGLGGQQGAGGRLMQVGLTQQAQQAQQGGFLAGGLVQLGLQPSGMVPGQLGLQQQLGQGGMGGYAPALLQQGGQLGGVLQSQQQAQQAQQQGLLVPGSSLPGQQLMSGLPGQQQGMLPLPQNMQGGILPGMPPRF